MRLSSEVVVCPAARAGVDALEQCIGLLNSIGDEAFRTPCSAMFGATIGQHVRHCLDHFAAAAIGADGETIDYDRRERGTLVESERAVALRELSEIRARFVMLGTSESEMDVRVRVMVDATGREVELRSTLGREIAFAAHHAIHHHAMMAAIAKELGLVTPAGFGKAPSTLHHERMGSRGEH